MSPISNDLGLYIYIYPSIDLLQPSMNMHVYATAMYDQGEIVNIFCKAQ